MNFVMNSKTADSAESSVQLFEAAVNSQVAVAKNLVAPAEARHLEGLLMAAAAVRRRFWEGLNIVSEVAVEVRLLAELPVVEAVMNFPAAEENPPAVAASAEVAAVVTPVRPVVAMAVDLE